MCFGGGGNNNRVDGRVFQGFLCVGAPLAVILPGYVLGQFCLRVRNMQQLETRGNPQAVQVKLTGSAQAYDGNIQCGHSSLKLLR